MNLNLIQEEIFTLIPNATDIIPSDFDFKNNLAIEIKVGDTVLGKDYCNDIDLKVTVVGTKIEKFNIQNEAINLDKILNKYIFKDKTAIIFRENVWYSSFYDKDKFNAVLLYSIRKYK